MTPAKAPVPGPSGSFTGRSRIGRLLAICGVQFIATAGASGVEAQTLREALQRAYQTNPVFRAQQRTVPAAAASVDRARAGYFPRISASADYGINDLSSSSTGSAGSISTRTRPRGVGLDVSQTLFDGARTYNGVGQANQILTAAQETLRDTEQSLLLEAVTAYVDVLRDRTIWKLERQNHASLAEQYRLISELFRFGDVTRTDVVQVEARVADSRARVSAAEAALKGSEAVYEQVIGSKPTKLASPRPADRLVPPTLDTALGQASLAHPLVLAAIANADAAGSQVNIAIGEHLPTISVTGSLAQQANTDVNGDRRLNASVFGRVSLPIFSGGETTAKVREAKENAGRRRIEIDAARAQVQANAIRAWSQVQSAKIRLSAAEEQVRAASTALKGVREEFGLGQRTATNVLDAVQDLLSASINLATAQRERVLTTYAVSRALGKLSLVLIDGSETSPQSNFFDTFASLSQPMRRHSVIPQWQLRSSSAGSSIHCEGKCGLRPTLAATLDLRPMVP